MFALFYYSGSADRLLKEIAEVGRLEGEEPLSISKLLEDSPELKDHLLEASKTLPQKPSPPIMLGRKVVLREYKNSDRDAALEACNGSAIFGGSSYSFESMFGWFNYGEGRTAVEVFDAIYAQSTEEKVAFSLSKRSTHVMLIEPSLRKPIGMISLLNNEPENLCICLGYIWLTVAYQNKKYIAHEAVLLLLQWLFRVGYRRVTVEADTRHIIYRKFLERCGFRLEAVMRKHKIFRGRINRDTALYVILRTEFQEIETKLKTLLKYPMKPTGKKIAGIDSNISLLQKPSRKLVPEDFEAVAKHSTQGEAGCGIKFPRRIDEYGEMRGEEGWNGDVIVGKAIISEANVRECLS